jgi:hypothetical protein
MDSGIIVYKKVVPGADIGETIQKCLALYEDKLHTGLSSSDEWYQKAMEIEGLLARHSEAFLPDRFKGKDYNRLRSVFAFPFEFPEEWCYPNLVPANRSFADGETVIKMRVDGANALVLPMYEVDVFYGNGNASSGNPKDMKRIRKYWESAVSLEEFTRDFVRPSEREYIWDSKDSRIEKPEVIIPEWSLEKISFLNAPEN